MAEVDNPRIRPGTVAQQTRVRTRCCGVVETDNLWPAGPQGSNQCFSEMAGTAGDEDLPA
jgi:hypothetical protein